MLEWTHRKIQNKSQGFSSLADAYDDLLYESKDETSTINNGEDLVATDEAPEFPTVDEMRAQLEPLLEVLGLSNISLELYPLVSRNVEMINCGFEQFKRNIPLFLRLVGENCQDECRKSGMNDKAIAYLCQGICPENYTPHLKVPLDFGGMASLSNFSLVKTHPTHDNLHQIIDVQLENNFILGNEKIWLPVFQGKIYNG